MRRTIPTLLLSLLLALPASAALAKPRPAVITATFTCQSVEVESSKDLSNVVLVFEDGSWQKFDGLDGHTGVFAGTGEHAGATIATAYVKSGNNHSGDGPGWGERHDAGTGCDDCDDLPFPFPGEPDDGAEETPPPADGGTGGGISFS